MTSGPTQGGGRWPLPLLLLGALMVFPGLLLGGGRLVASLAAPTTRHITVPPSPTEAAQPPDLHAAATALDLHTRDVLLFGGYHPTSGGHVTDETWAWDGLGWRRLRPATSPPPRRDAVAVMDLAARSVLVTGGIGAGPRTPLSDLWSWDGRTWSALPVRGDRPRPSHLPLASWDVRDRSLLFLCTAETAGGPVVQTWEYAAGAWTERTPPREPVLRGPALLSADPTTGHSLLVAPGPVPGGPGETWHWDGSDWTEEGATPAGFSSLSAHLAADGIVAGDVVLTQEPATTWMWDGSSWQVARTSLMPPVQSALVATLGSPILFGGVSPDAGFVVKFRWVDTIWLELDPHGPGDMVLGRRDLSTPPPVRDLSTPPPLPA